MRPLHLVLLPLLCLGGCYTYTPVDVKMIDAFTKQPISGVRVQADYRRFIELFPPKLDHAVTDAEGIARLDVCTNYAKGGNVAVFSFIDSGYLLDQSVPRACVEIPTEPLRTRADSTRRVDVPVITLAEYRRRYR